ncbi:MAG: TPM domain-containing protein [Vicinamibacteraceae bacterium]
MRPSAAAFVLWSMVASAALADAQTLPKPTSKVSDSASVLTPAARADLESLLKTLEKDTTADVVVATTTSLGGMSVEEYGNRVFNEWKIGKAALDNGVLVLVAPTERQVRIEVGYGLEGVIPDVLAGAIIRDDFLPRFRDGNLEAGIVTGVRRIADLVRAKHVPTPEQLAAVESSSSRPGVFGWIVFGTFGAMWLAGVVMAGAMFGQAVNVRSVPSLAFGVFAVALFAGLPIYFLPRVAVALVPAALIGAVWGYRRRPLGGGASRSAPSSSWDWSVSTGSSGSDSSSSSSDSSDSGGGSSGGGGASGSW